MISFLLIEHSVFHPLFLLQEINPRLTSLVVVLFDSSSSEPWNPSLLKLWFPIFVMQTKQFRTKEIYMARRRKPEVWLNNELDRISELPDPLICRVLYHLPTKDAVRTSVLSTRWRTLWLWVPRLGLNYRVFQKKDALVNFGDRFFDSDRVSSIDKVELDVESN